MRYLTIVYKLPDDLDPALLVNHPHASAFAWSHKMDDCRKLMMENEQLKEERNRAGVELRNAVAKAVRAERDTWPNLQPVIAWLENGCDPKEAAKELRSYDEAIRARQNK